MAMSSSRRLEICGRHWFKPRQVGVLPGIPSQAMLSCLLQWKVQPERSGKKTGSGRDSSSALSGPASGKDLAGVQDLVWVKDGADLAHESDLRLVQGQGQVAPASRADAMLASDHPA